MPTVTSPLLHLGQGSNNNGVVVSEPADWIFAYGTLLTVRDFYIMRDYNMHTTSN
eukprot:m.125264 g.125264  ORF g.125264 m.125264 type:complete len:55 (-) comp17318_c0_seq3:1481-1645(-)